jgi:hypothetical protein
MNDIDDDRPVSRGTRFQQVLFGNRWAAIAGVAFWGLLAAIAAARSAWVLFTIDLAFVAMTAVGLAARSRMQRRGRIFDATPEPEPAPLGPGRAAVVIRRRPDFSGASIAYHVWIDDACVGPIRVGETRQFDVEPGEHRVGVGRRGRPSDDSVWGVDLAAGEVGSFLCRSRFDGGIRLQPSASSV